MGSQTTERNSMSFRDNVKDNAKSVMIQAFITSLFADPHIRFGDILEDLIETDDPDDDWMRETLYDLEIGELVRAGMKVMGLTDEDAFVIHTEDVEVGDDGIGVGGDIDDEEEVGPAPPPQKKKKKSKNSTEDTPKKKKKKKKKPKNSVEATPKKKKKKKKDSPPATVKEPQDTEGDETDSRRMESEWRGYLKLIVKALRTHKAYDEDTAVNNGAILNHIHGDNEWDKPESADLRRGIEDLVADDKVSKVGQRRGTRYHLN